MVVRDRPLTVVLRAVLASGLSDPSAIAVDDSGIYFTNPAAGGLVEKIAK